MSARRRRSDAAHVLRGLPALALAASRRSPLRAEHRRRLFSAVQAYPGLHLAKLAREAAVDEALARYHVRVLVDRGLVTEVREGRFLRYYPTTEGELGRQEVIAPDDKRALAVLRRPVPLRIVLELLGREAPATMGELADAAGVAPATATYHVGHLVEAGVAAVEARGRERLVRLVDAKRVRALVAGFPPPDDIVQGFIELWDQLEL